jgi:Cu+-exporting ATPase
MLQKVKSRGPVYLLSGDVAPAVPYWEDYLDADNIYFQQSPFDKLDFIELLQQKGGRVLMVGDGLNDAGALRTASVGLAVNEDEAGFNPACDGIIDADQLLLLPWVQAAAGQLRGVLYFTYGIAIVYNLIGLSYAVTGTLSPIVAAILMPLSSITIVVIATLGALLVGRK